MGRPILTSDAPGCRETVIHGKDAFLVTVKDVEVLAERMCWMINHPDARAKMGKASLALAYE